jgi:hypothetical protein
MVVAGMGRRSERFFAALRMTAGRARRGAGER